MCFATTPPHILASLHARSTAELRGSDRCRAPSRSLVRSWPLPAPPLSILTALGGPENERREPRGGALGSLHLPPRADVRAICALVAGGRAAQQVARRALQRALPCEQRDGSDDGCDMRVVYHYDDSRGTVRDDAAKCGPWRITAKQSRADGIEHPSSAEMTTLLLPGGPSAWCMKKSAEGKPCAAELFLHHGEHLRMSAGVVHAADGALQTLALIREDARAFLNDDSAALSPPCWSPGTEAAPSRRRAGGCAAGGGRRGRKGEGDRLTATLVRRTARRHVGLDARRRRRRQRPCMRRQPRRDRRARHAAVGRRLWLRRRVVNGGGGRCRAVHDRVQLDCDGSLSEVKHAWFLQAPEAL